MKIIFLLVIASIFSLIACQENPEKPWEVWEGKVKDNFTNITNVPRWHGVDDWYYQDESLFAILAIMLDSNYHYGSRIQKSTDHGVTWNDFLIINPDSLPVTDTSAYVYVEDFTIANDGNYFIIGANCLFKSTDKGKSWMRLNNPKKGITDRISFELIHAEKLFKDNAGNLYVSNEIQGFYKSSDNGVTWRYNGEYLYYKYFSSFEEKLILINDNKFKISFDKGETWEITKVDNDSIDYHTEYPYFSIIRGENGNLYFSVSRYFSNPGFILYSKDNGISWKSYEVNNKNMNIEKLIFVNNKNEIYAVFEDGNGSNYGEDGIYKSTDSGKSWNLVISLYWADKFFFTNDNHVLYWDSNGMWRSKFKLE